MLRFGHRVLVSVLTISALSLGALGCSDGGSQGNKPDTADVPLDETTVDVVEPAPETTGPDATLDDTTEGDATVPDGVSSETTVPDAVEPDGQPGETTDATDPDGTPEETTDTTGPEVEVVEPTGAEAEIGPSGGELTFDGARLVVPPGALEEPVVLTLTRTDAPVPSGYTGYSAVWRFEPAGLAFAVPARVEIPFVGDASRATVFWSKPSGLGYTWHPTTRDGNVAIADVEHFSDGFVGDGTGYDEAADPTCVATRVLQGRKTAPSGIALFFGVEDCEGRPVKNLTERDFKVFEANESLGAEANATLLPKPGAMALVTLVLDLSVSNDPHRVQLIAAARNFVTTLYDRMPGQVLVAIDYFAAMAGSVQAQRHSILEDDVLAQLDALETLVVSQPNGINLHGAIMNALSRLTTARTNLGERSGSGALATSHIVVFTNSRDTTKLHTGAPGEVGDAVRASPTHVVGVGLQGPDYDGAKLRSLAPDGLYEAVNVAGLPLAFSAAANRVIGHFEGTYFLAYCTPTVAGTHYVHIGVDGAELASERGWSFTGTASAPGCSRSAFLGACEGRECGGLACGVCDDREEWCDAASGQCSWICDAQQKCGDTPFTNANGYAYSCPDTDTRARCEPEWYSCTNIQTSAAHCGECDNPCSTNGICVGAECGCPAGQLDCAGACLRVLTDRNNCGLCNNVCATGASCAEGRCTCPTGQIPCSGACRTTATDRNNCGTCGNVCPTSGSCVNSRCTCPSGWIVCDGACKNVTNDRLMCGSCTRTCVLGCDASTCLESRAIELGSQHACTLTNRGTWCWGLNSHYQGGNTSFTRTRPTKGPTSFDFLALGSNHSCGVSGGVVRCWGSNTMGQLGRPSNITRDDESSQIPGISQVVSIDAGGNTTCTVSTGAKVSCWGENTYGQIGDGTTTLRRSGTEITALQGATQVAVGLDFACAVMGDLTGRCWGRNNFGQLGANLAVAQATTPQVVESLTRLTKIVVGSQFACALNGGQVWCWGRNFRGQLGNGTTTDSAFPVLVEGLADITDLVAGESHVCGVTASRQVWCWGIRPLHPIANATSETTPYELTGLGEWVELKSGKDFMCLRRPNGELACWGNNNVGQLATDNNTIATEPTAVVWQ